MEVFLRLSGNDDEIQALLEYLKMNPALQLDILGQFRIMQIRTEQNVLVHVRIPFAITNEQFFAEQLQLSEQVYRLVTTQHISMEQILQWSFEQIARLPSMTKVKAKEIYDKRNDFIERNKIEI